MCPQGTGLVSDVNAHVLPESCANPAAAAPAEGSPGLSAYLLPEMLKDTAF